MAQITLGGNPVNTIGNLPAVGTKIPEFKLVRTDLSVLTNEDIKGKNVVLSIFPSLGTGTCAAALRQFNIKAASMENTVVVCISKDLPFAQAGFCAAEGINNVIMGSAFRDGTFGKTFGVTFIDGKFEGLLSRAVIVTDSNGIVQYTEQVQETANEPDYDAAIKAVEAINAEVL